MPSPDAAGLCGLRFLPVAEPLFDALPDVVFFVKDAEARYVAVNQTLVQRCGVAGKAELVGRTTREIFPAPLGRAYYEQDLEVLRRGAALRDWLELHLYARGGPGWCVTTKLPLRDGSGAVIGLVGVSSDVHAPAARDQGYRKLAQAVRHIQAHYALPLRLPDLAGLCGLSVYRFEQRMKRVFQITAGQFISKTRVDAACRMLKEGKSSIAEVALACGFADQSAFTRHFRATTGLTPSEYRRADSSDSVVRRI
jgi:AraC-like DNA-binding protein